MCSTKLPQILSRLRFPCSAIAFTTFAVSLSFAQSAPAADVATLAKYDTNRNGKLDPDEIAAMEAAQKSAVPVVTEPASKPAGDEVVSLSPFEVVADNKGYFASNTMSGTRLNSKIEDLGQSITV